MMPKLCGLDFWQDFGGEGDRDHVQCEIYDCSLYLYVTYSKLKFNI